MKYNIDISLDVEIEATTKEKAEDEIYNVLSELDCTKHIEINMIEEVSKE